MEYYIKALQNYANFNGRARRSEYWYFVLFNFLIGLATMIMDSLTGMQIINPIYSIAMIIPGLAVGVRRLHDIGKSGWMLLVALIPIAGAIWLLVLFCQDSQPGENEFGANPKEIF